MESQEITSFFGKCSLCETTFTRNSSFKRHVLKFHPDQQKELLQENIKHFKCETCGKTFSHMNNLKQHERSAHELATTSTFQHKCVFCEYTDSKRYNLIKHYEEKHHVIIESEEFVFENKLEFEKWKKEVENSTNTFFRKTCAYNDPANVFHTMKFYCNRSGYYKSKSDGIRKSRKQGSLKIGGICPAEMNVTIHKDNKYVVKYIKSHCGHENDLQNLYMNKDQKESIAVKIAAGVPFRVILDEVRDSLTTETELERSHLLTRKDLYNIAQSFQLKSDDRIPVDGLSVEDWIKEMCDGGSVIYYKLKGSFCNVHTDLLQDDFVIVIMNQCQKEMLEKHYYGCICIDRTNCLNANKIEIISLLIADNDKNQGIPCAFLISNRVDAETISLFLMCIKEVIGKTLLTNIFLSDLDSLFYSSWLKVMDTPCFRFFCPWQVERTWRNDLQKIKSQKLKLLVYEHLKRLQQQKNKEEFDKTLETFMKQWSIKETAEFLINFQQKFMVSTDAWAQYYKTQNEIILNSDLQTTHEEISKLFVFGKNNNRLNLAITALMNFVTYKILGKNTTSGASQASSRMENQIEIEYLE